MTAILSAYALCQLTLNAAVSLVFGQSKLTCAIAVPWTPCIGFRGCQDPIKISHTGVPCFKRSHPFLSLEIDCIIPSNHIYLTAILPAAHDPGSRSAFSSLPSPLMMGCSPNSQSTTVFSKVRECLKALIFRLLF